MIGTSFLDADPYVRAARPVLSDLRDELHETVHLARLDDDQIVYLVTFEAERDPRKLSRVGRCLPAAATSLGKALLAERQEMPNSPLEQLTPHTITDPDELRADLERTRERGYAIDNQEATAGLRCIGMALRYTEPVTDAISCSVPIDRMSTEHMAMIASTIEQARQQLEDSAPLPGTF
jgi:DNA-binding IclR family transcriptional regulator